MYRHLYKQPSILNRFIQAEFQKYRSEEFSFRNASLAQLRDFKLQGNEDMNDFLPIWESLHQSSIEEQWEISKNSLLPQIYQILNSLHSFTRQQPLIQYPQIEQMSRLTALLDPDMFPVQDLKEKLHKDTPQMRNNNFHSKRSVCVRFVNRQAIGLKQEIVQLIIQMLEEVSSQKHKQVKGKVQFVLIQNYYSIQPGTLLGFVPGITYSSYKELMGVYSEPNTETHFFRFDGFIVNFSEKIYNPVQLGFSKEMYDTKIEKLNEFAQLSRFSYINPKKGGFESVFGEEINPYAVGHLINHPGPNLNQNVCLIDIFIPKKFFPEHLMRFWPNVAYTNEPDYMQIDQYHLSMMKNLQKNHLRGLGFISLKEIKSDEELFLDYFDSALFEIKENPPDWLLIPPPLSPYICKGRFENTFNVLGEILENRIFNQTEDGKNYDKFIQQVKREKQILDQIKK